MRSSHSSEFLLVLVEWKAPRSPRWFLELLAVPKTLTHVVSGRAESAFDNELPSFVGMKVIDEKATRRGDGVAPGDDAA